MTRNQTKMFVSFKATEALLKATTETAEIAGLPPRLTLLSANLAEMGDCVQIQLNTTPGKTAARDELVQAMIDDAIELAATVSAYATAAKLTELDSRVRLNSASFQRLRISHRPVLAQSIHDSAQEVLSDLASLGVTSARLAALEARIAAAEEAIAQPRLAIATRKGATNRLARLIAETDALLRDEVDQLLLPLRRTAPEFHTEYRSVRDFHRESRDEAPDGDVDGASAATLVVPPAQAPTAIAA